MFLQWYPIQIHSKPEPLNYQERRIENIYSNWNSIRIKFVKKATMSNPVESLVYIKCYKTLAILSDTTVHREDLKPHWESVKGYMFLGHQEASLLQFLKDFTNYTEKQ